MSEYEEELEQARVLVKGQEVQFECHISRQLSVTLMACPPGL